MFIVIVQMLGQQYTFSPVLYYINKVFHEILHFEESFQLVKIPNSTVTIVNNRSQNMFFYNTTYSFTKMGFALKSYV